ncbi:uncharacterized histidine-rich protein DDB_G0274557-like [Actinia tenebrosa]|uniref:Uncharacterized histidine-rich protein DDB_G0274557-like n=1 Tax=Actinia tenebrosa TaxID=6105 RepID=A0A6P8HRL4_ACTTE|nr:uncharacterized histidine-rich protein DDB_G0274557-like [Actinia tenebrosa]
MKFFILTFVITSVVRDVVSRPAAPNPASSHLLLSKKQTVIAVPPVASSDLRGPYLPPANGDNQIFLPHHHYHTGYHFSHGLLVRPQPGYHVYHHHVLHPAGLHQINHVPYGHHMALGHVTPHTIHHLPYGHHGHFTHIPYGHVNSIPIGMSDHHAFDDPLWPSMDLSGPVAVSDPNDGLYQEPRTGTLVPRPIMPQQYPVLLDHSSNMAGENGPGLVFVGGTAKSAIPHDVAQNMAARKASQTSAPQNKMQD